MEVSFRTFPMLGTVDEDLLLAEMYNRLRLEEQRLKNYKVIQKKTAQLLHKRTEEGIDLVEAAQAIIDDSDSADRYEEAVQQIIDTDTQLSQVYGLMNLFTAGSSYSV